MIRGTKRPVVKKQTIDLRASIHNRFDLEVIDAATGELKRKACAFNVICDAFWDKLFYVNNGTWTPQSAFNYILYGKGSGTPATTDTTLFSKIGALSVTAYGAVTCTVDNRTGVARRQAVGTINAEDAVGEIITELGIGYDATHCVTHAMLQDMEGNPISIEKTNTDVIKIYATIFVHWPDGGWYSGAVNVKSSGNGGSLVSVLAGGGATPETGGFLRFARIARITGTSQATGKTDTSTVEVNKTNKTITVSGRVNAASLNLPIRALALEAATSNWNYDAALWIVLGSWFTAPAISAESVGTGDGSTTGFATAFPVKTGGTVYVDGVAASGVTVRSGPAAATNLEQWFNQLNAAGADALTESGTPIYATTSNIPTGELYPAYLAVNATTPAFENPFSSMGLGKVQAKLNNGGGSYITGTLVAQASDDCQTWTDVCTVSGNSSSFDESAVPAAYRQKKYWRFKNTADMSRYWYIHAVGAAADEAHNIVFDTPPAAGAVITADYVPDCIAKDSNHVLDLSATLTLGEYQEA